jgi:hypothetical protein
MTPSCDVNASKLMEENLYVTHPKKIAPADGIATSLTRRSCGLSSNQDGPYGKQ